MCSGSDVQAGVVISRLNPITRRDFHERDLSCALDGKALHSSRGISAVRDPFLGAPEGSANQRWALPGVSQSAVVRDGLYDRFREAFLGFEGVRFRTCGNVLLCKTLQALPLALSGTNEYHEIVLIGHVPALAFRAQWFQTARWTCLRKTDSEN
jgi:hypothetical protein